MIVPRNPFPPSDGALLVVQERIKHLLLLGHKVTCFVIKGGRVEEGINNPNYKNLTMIFSEWNPSNSIVSNCIKIFKNNIPPLVSYYYSFQVYKEIEKLLVDNDYDRISIDHLHLSYYGKLLKQKNNNIPIILFHHNIETELYKSFAKQTNGIKKLYFKINQYLTYFYEKKIYNKFDSNVFISKKDFNKAIEISVNSFNGFALPNTVDFEKYTYVHKKNETIINIGFIASMDYEPNNKGAIWFVENVIPMLEKSKIQYKFYIVGKNPSSEVLTYQKIKNITVTGWVVDDVEYYHKMDVIVSPIFMGAGVKIKVLNALSCGKILLATPKAVEGIEGLIPNQHFKLVNSPTDFFNEINAIYHLQNKIDNNNMMLNGREFILQNYKNKELVLNTIF